MINNNVISFKRNNKTKLEFHGLLQEIHDYGKLCFFDGLTGDRLSYRLKRLLALEKIANIVSKVAPSESIEAMNEREGLNNIKF